MSLKLRLLLSATILGSAAASAAEPVPTDAHAIEGLGERLPAGAKNVSLSPKFKVYTFEQQGVKYVQINSLQDEVLTVLVVTPGAQQQLPIGSATGTPVVFVDPQKLP
ncbi:hypothetical protein [Xanthomonas rydalmerensis]|uniref:Uncharacterized protein n=1 Tax=Xanthomonas rydalmerensis TaxID=3046274 RepID=A0ABZ0JTV3_9XANT|nr:hypothetical protein [Xanthomonas sp. DM-2023]WOS42733.1 hypothetical protein QN243_09975 [Xanthomonas sp. DM-2023]WOS46919.1 hypothetical protein QN242_09975 [Xanthomonas sp. DM-2023]WOS51098.1 hypothetical protein QN240_09975 [Xanthomonas sp. DM-2023]WOS55279.1 hypothetical protein QN244_09975 [Xanthomonas sp. DM-2023]WOS59461.1 hypothetical protein QN245_09975 [Xanthomonas sp. DM-2023]